MIKNSSSPPSFQISEPNELLTANQIIGETLAIVQGSTRIWSAGAYWDTNKFPNRTYFGSHEYKENFNTRRFKVEDLAHINSFNEIYTENPWFQSLKKQWSTNFDNLDEFHLNIQGADNPNGEHSHKPPYTTSYKAGNMEHGYWTSPKYDCDGYVKKWLITYAAPFFGWDESKSNIEFK